MWFSFLGLVAATAGDMTNDDDKDNRSNLWFLGWNEGMDVLIPRMIKDTVLPEWCQWTLMAVLVLVLSVTVLLPWLWFVLQGRALIAGGIPYLSSQPEGWSYPWLGQALNYLKYRPWDLMMKWHGRHGPIFSFCLFGSWFVSVSSPHLLKQVLQSKISAVKKDVANTMKHFLVILGTGIVTSEDDSWMRQRLKMSMPLRRDVLQWIPTQTAIALERLCQQTLDPACQQGHVVPVGSFLRHLTLQVISATFLSISADESDSTFANLYLPIVDESNKRVWHPYRAYLFILPQFWIHLYNVHCLNQYVSRLIRQRWKQRREQPPTSNPTRSDSTNTDRNHDILDLVLQVYETEFPEATGDLPESAVCQFRDEMKTFLLAGHETSAAMMTWALYELMANHALREQVIQEAQAVFGQDPPNANDTTTTSAPHVKILTAEQLSDLALSEACLKESLRKYSVVPIVARRTVHDLYLEGEEKDGNNKSLHVPKGCSVMINIQSIHMNPTLWPQPHKFDPYRFVQEVDGPTTTTTKAKRCKRLEPKQPEPFTFVPFIAGPRNCLGQHLSLLESKMVISWLLQTYRFTLPEGVDLQVQNWKFGNNDSDPRHRFIIPVIPKQELMVHVTKR